MRARGFTLVELMLVVTIIAIIVAVAIPALSSSRRSATEATVVSMLRSAHTINELYRQRHGEYAPQPDDWVTAGLIPGDGVHGLAGGASGYLYAYLSTGTEWMVQADPEVPGDTGDRFFYQDYTGVIRFNPAGPAGPGDAPVD